MRIFAAFTIVLLLTGPVSPRPVPLDSVYIHTNSSEYQRLLFTRLDYYQEMGAQYIDSKTAFSAWLNGNELLYIKELGGTSHIMTSSIRTRKKTAIRQFKGTMLSARVSSNGRHIAIKYFTAGTIPRPALKVVDLLNRSATSFKTASAGSDYSFSHDGNVFYYKDDQCIIAHTLYTSREKPSLCSADAPQWDETTVVLTDTRETIFISGSSGNYDVFMRRQPWKRLFSAITPLEVFLSGDVVFYSGGSPGNYSVAVYDIASSKSTSLLTGTFNPGLHAAGSLAIFTNNAFVVLYDSMRKKLLRTNIESDEAVLSPDGFTIALTLYNRLFILPYQTAVAFDPRSKRYLDSIQDLYSAIANNKTIHVSPYTPVYITTKLRTILSLLSQ